MPLARPRDGVRPIEAGDRRPRSALARAVAHEAVGAVLALVLAVVALRHVLATARVGALSAEPPSLEELFLRQYGSER